MAEEKPDQPYKEEITVTTESLFDPLYTAIYEGKLDQVKARLRAGDKVNVWAQEKYSIQHCSPLWLAAEALIRSDKKEEMEERRSIFKLLLQQPEAKEGINHKFPQFFDQDLIEDIWGTGNVEAAKLLLERDAEMTKTHPGDSLLSKDQAEQLQNLLSSVRKDNACLPDEIRATQQHAQLGVDAIEAQPLSLGRNNTLERG